jgi:hypothetical protein
MSLAKKIFIDAGSRRRSYPLANGGAYKIQEAADRLHRASENIDRLKAFHRTRTGSQCFISCCWSERGAWLKDALLDVAFRLGYEIMPGIPALKFDGLSGARISELEILGKSQTESLLAQVDDVHSQIKSRMKIEYEHWDNDESLIQPVLNRTVNFADDIVSYYETHWSLHGVSEKILLGGSQGTSDSVKRL